ncbi:MAG TPA: aminopeptidase [Crocinitomicaceae bacterium]|nr:M1 family peptidase [Flavobacteriales bacterium]HBW86978.1 aminopeptidase [Crocinitomicaceae bacterium]
MKLLLQFIFSLVLLSCIQETKNKSVTENLSDPFLDDHSYSNLNEIKTRHLHLELDVNFRSKKIFGVARHRMLNLNNADTAIFDIKGIEIQKVTTGEKNAENEADFVIGKYDKDSILGQPLLVKIDPKDSIVNIYYKTTENSEALDWLEPKLTSSKLHPFLYTQGQAILTRTWIPIQDSPSNRFTYSAEVKVPKHLKAVMSAKNSREKSENGIYNFSMPNSIPSYLIALAVGDLNYTPLSSNTGFYCEPQLTKKCKNEFVDLPKMLVAAEKLYGKYRWNQYDLLVLPYSFPFGGMENPMLTFVNPTIITGDRSLVSVIAHELAHSWSGNLVSNKTWNDFWINEGFTVYFEHRIMEELYGKEIADILALVEIFELDEEIIRIKNSKHPEDSKLLLNLNQRNPDEGMTDIAYVKGAWFLRSLEARAGRKVFDKFLNYYFSSFAFSTISTRDFIDYLKKNLLSQQNIDFNYNEWINQEGLPNNKIEISSPRLLKMKELAYKFSNEEDVFAPKIRYERIRIKKKIKKKKIVEQLKKEDFITQEWQMFIRYLPKSITVDKLERLNSYFGFNRTENAEIALDWFTLCINANYDGVLPDIERFLRKIGRRKFVLPLYELLAQKPQYKNFAKTLFDSQKNYYHAVTKNSVEKLFMN